VGHGLLIHDVSRSHTTTHHHSQWDSSGGVISFSQIPLPDKTQHSQQTDIHALGRIRTHILGRQAAADLAATRDRLNELYSSPNIFRVIKSRRMGWVGNVAGMGERGSVFRVLWGVLRERDHLEDPGVDGRIILRWIFMKWDVRVWTGSSWFRIRKGGGHL